MNRVWKNSPRMNTAWTSSMWGRMGVALSAQWAGPVFRAVGLVCAAGLLTAATPHPDNLPDRPLQGAEGVTSLSGQVMDVTGQGLAGVELSVGASHTVTDNAGRFLLPYVIPGKTVLQIDGRRAGAKRDVDYGFHEVSVEAAPGQTTVLPFRNWLTRINHTHDVVIESPTRSEVVVRTPAFPDFELRIPAGVAIRDVDCKVVRRVGITAVPSNRLPAPLPEKLEVPMVPLIHPGAACLYDAKGGVGTATMVFPNFLRELPKARAVLWRYEPDGNGWAPYGMGSVSADGRQVVPDPGVVITDFGSAECEPGKATRQPPIERPEHRRRGVQSDPAPSVVPGSAVRKP